MERGVLERMEGRMRIERLIGGGVLTGLLLIAGDSPVSTQPPPKGITLVVPWKRDESQLPGRPVATHAVAGRRPPSSTARHRYQLATVLKGAHRVPYFASAFGAGRVRLRYAIANPLRTP